MLSLTEHTDSFPSSSSPDSLSLWWSIPLQSLPIELDSWLIEVFISSIISVYFSFSISISLLNYTITPWIDSHVSFRCLPVSWNSSRSLCPLWLTRSYLLFWIVHLVLCLSYFHWDTVRCEYLEEICRPDFSHFLCVFFSLEKHLELGHWYLKQRFEHFF